jgi:hypothetical protein
MSEPLEQAVIDLLARVQHLEAIIGALGMTLSALMWAINQGRTE